MSISEWIDYFFASLMMVTIYAFIPLTFVILLFFFLNPQGFWENLATTIFGFVLYMIYATVITAIITRQ